MYPPYTPPDEPKTEYKNSLVIGDHYNDDGDFESTFTLEYRYFHHRYDEVEVSEYDVTGLATKDEIIETIEKDLNVKRVCL